MKTEKKKIQNNLNLTKMLILTQKLTIMENMEVSIEIKFDKLKANKIIKCVWKIEVNSQQIFDF